MPTADDDALAWAEAITNTTLHGPDLEWLAQHENAQIPVWCRHCGSLFTALEPAGNRCAVIPVDLDHLGTIMRPDSPKDSNGYPLTTFETVTIVCPTCETDSPQVTATKLARYFRRCHEADQPMIWPPPHSMSLRNL